MPRLRDGVPAGSVGDAATAVVWGIGIEDLAIEAGFRNADPVAITWEGGEVADDDQVVVAVLRAAQESHDGVIGVVKINPLKPRPFKIDFIERRLRAVEPVQLGNQSLDLAMRLVLQQVPGSGGGSIRSTGQTRRP